MRTNKSVLEYLSHVFLNEEYSDNVKDEIENLTLTLFAVSFLTNNKSVIIRTIDSKIVYYTNDVIRESLKLYKSYIINYYDIVQASENIMIKFLNNQVTNPYKNFNLMLLFISARKKIISFKNCRQQFIKQFPNLLVQYFSTYLYLQRIMPQRKLDQLMNNKIRDRETLLREIPLSKEITLDVLLHCIKKREQHQGQQSILRTASSYYDIVYKKFKVKADTFKQWIKRNKKYFPRKVGSNKEILSTMSRSEAKNWYQNYSSKRLPDHEVKNIHNNSI
jgi:hypothetical protein